MFRLLLKFRLIYFLSLLVWGGIGGGCTHSEDVSKRLRVHIAQEPVTLDPTLAEDGHSLQILNNVWDGLMGYNGQGKLEKRLAKSYTVSKDFKKFEFVLNEQAQWSDGKPIRIEDFITAFRRVLSPTSTSKQTPNFLSIRAAKLYHAGKVSWENVGVKESNGRLVIELESPVPYFLHVLTLPSAYPLRQDILDAHQGKWSEDAPTTGPYQIVSHQLNRKWVLKLNPNYFDQNKISDSIPDVEFQIVVEEGTALNLFERGQLDILMRIPSLDYSRLKDRGLVQVTPFLATYYISFNRSRPPFNDRDWRRAVAGAIRRDEIISVLGSDELPALSWIPKGLEGFIPYQDPRPIFQSSIEKVKKLAPKQGSVPAAFDTGVRNSRILEKIQNDLLQTLGLKISLTNLDWRSYVKQLDTDPPSLHRFGRLSPMMDPIPFLKIWTTGDPNNFTKFSYPEYDRLVQEIDQLEPGAVRASKILKAQKILLEDEAVLVPIYHYVQSTAVASRVKGCHVSPFGVISLYNVTF